MWLYLTNSFVPAESATLSVQDRGFRFGDGVFETIAVHTGAPYQWNFHLARLERGLKALDIPFDTSRLHTICAELLLRNHITEGLLRIAISRGAGSQGYLPLPDITPTLVIETPTLPAIPAEPLVLWRSDIEKISPRALPAQCKTSQGLNSTLVRMEAAKQRCHDGLQLNAAGHICETGAANIFWLRNGALHTPALTCGVLDGSMRAAVLRLSPWPVNEGAFPLEALQNADAVWLTSVTLKAAPVAMLKPMGWRFDSVAATAQINALLTEDIRADTAAWHRLSKSA